MKLKLLLTIVLINLAPVLSAAQQLIGDPLNGDAPVDRFGWSVSLSADGSRLAIGAINNDASGESAGQVKVYERFNDTWSPLGQDLVGAAPADLFGFAVSLSANGKRLVVGASRSDAAGENAGQVRIFEEVNGDWVSLGLPINGATIGEEFGRAVAISGDGNRIVAGARLSSANGELSGQVKVFEWNGSMWEILGEPINGAPSSEAGHAVAISQDGQRIAIGAPGNPTVAAQTGQVQIFALENGQWVPVGSPISGKEVGDQAGWSVSLSGDGNRVAVASRLHAPDLVPAGQVRLFSWDGTNWNQTGQDINGQVQDEDFGYAISLSANGERVAIGAPFNTANGTNAGQIQVFELVNDSWLPLGNALQGSAQSSAGLAVALAADGNSMAFGAPRATVDEEALGQVRVFDYSMATATHFPVIASPLIYPNPTSRILKVEGGYDHYTIFDSTGKVVGFSTQASDLLELHHLPAGTYFLQLEIDEQLSVIKILKED
ncbi:MAG: T9SS type A sorting domain-containing protein [Bacteroidota bacterium]